LLVDHPLAVRRQLRKDLVDAARQLGQVTAVNLHAPDVESPGPVGGEKDVAAIARDRREKIVVRVNGQLSLVTAIPVHQPDVPVAADTGAIGDAIVRRPGDALAPDADFRIYLARV